MLRPGMQSVVVSVAASIVSRDQLKAITFQTVALLVMCILKPKEILSIYM